MNLRNFCSDSLGGVGIEVVKLPDLLLVCAEDGGVELGRVRKDPPIVISEGRKYWHAETRVATSRLARAAGNDVNPDPPIVVAALALGEARIDEIDQIAERQHKVQPAGVRQSVGVLDELPESIVEVQESRRGGITYGVDGRVNLLCHQVVTLSHVEIGQMDEAHFPARRTKAERMQRPMNRAVVSIQHQVVKRRPGRALCQTQAAMVERPLGLRAESPEPGFSTESGGAKRGADQPAGLGNVGESPGQRVAVEVTLRRQPKREFLSSRVWIRRHGLNAKGRRPVLLLVEGEDDISPIFRKRFDRGNPRASKVGAQDSRQLVRAHLSLRLWTAP